jgi:hypothetical protein
MTSKKIAAALEHVSADIFASKPLASNVVPLEAPQEATPVTVAAPFAKGTVVRTAKKTLLYMPPLAARKFKEIAFHEDCKPHDVYMEALREYLERRGHTGLL